MRNKISWVAGHWLQLFTVVWGIYVGLPFLAPLFMFLGLNALGEGIYTVYSFACHQLPQRSFFLFGPKTMYSLEEIQAAFQLTNDPLVLRQFMGSESLGWKVAWSDRMVSMFTLMLPVALAWFILRRKLKAIPVWAFVLLLAPMFVDGTSHLVSDIAGIGKGFRDTNVWLATLTNHALSPGFYAGDSLGSFNSTMRLVTGLLFAVGVVWFGFPYIRESLSPSE